MATPSIFSASRSDIENPAEESVRDLQESLNKRASEAREALLTRIALTTALAAVTGYL